MELLTKKPRKRHNKSQCKGRLILIPNNTASLELAERQSWACVGSIPQAIATDTDEEPKTLYDVLDEFETTAERDLYHALERLQARSSFGAFQDALPLVLATRTWDAYGRYSREYIPSNVRAVCDGDPYVSGRKD